MSTNSIPSRRSHRLSRATFILLFLILSAIIVLNSTPVIARMHLIGGPGTPYLSTDASTIVTESCCFSETHAHKWTKDGGWIDLGVLSGGQNNLSFARAASNNGNVIVGASTSSKAPYGWEAFRWRNGTMSGIALGVANDVSSDGNTIVGQFESGSRRGIVWRLGSGAITQPFALPNNITYVDAQAVSRDGRIIVGLAYDPTVSQYDKYFGFYWSSMDGLHLLPGRATDLSGDGSFIVGFRALSMSDWEIVRWQKKSNRSGIYFSETVIKKISGGGSVWTNPKISGNGKLIVLGPEIWTEDDGMQSVEQYVHETLKGATGGWSNLVATDISDNGKVIVGMGAYQGSGPHIWKADDTPEPQTLYLDFDEGLVNYRGDAFNMPGAGLSGNEIKTITEKVAKIFAPFNISVSSSLSPPPTSPYSTIYIGGDRDFLINMTGVDSWWLYFWGSTMVGQAESVDVRNRNHSDNALVLSGELSTASGANMDLIAQVIAHEAGHLLGMFHVDKDNQLMYPCVTPTNIAITNNFYRVANGCPTLVYDVITNVNNYLALGKYVGLANGNAVTYDDGWWDTFTRRIALDPVWASSTIIFDAKLAVLYSDDAGPTLFNIGDMRDGDTYELEAPITDWAKVYIYGSSVPGGAVDIYGSPNDIMEKAPSDLSESDLAGYAHEVQEWHIYQHEKDLLTEIGKIGVDIEVKNNKCDINLDGRFDGRDVAEFVKWCGKATIESSWCKLNAKWQGKKWYDTRCPAEGVPWLCDLSEDGMFDGRDVQQYVKDCTRT